MPNENDQRDRLVASIDDRLTTIEEGFKATHEQEGLYERIRGLEKFRKRAYWVVTVVVGGTISIALKILFL